MEENILKIPYAAFREDWDLLQKFLVIKGNLKYIIVGNVDLRKRPDVLDLGNLVGVEGDLVLRNSSVESLGELTFVEGFCNLFDCKKIKTLGKLKKVGGDLDLTWSFIQSLGELEFVDRDFWLYGCKNIKGLGKVKRIGKSLELGSSSIESLNELEFIGKNLNIINTNIPLSEIDNVEIGGRIVR